MWYSTEERLSPIAGIERVVALASQDRRAMKVWLLLLLALAAALILAACAGNDWASVFDVARALMGDTTLRSRLLVEGRLQAATDGCCCLC